MTLGAEQPQWYSTLIQILGQHTESKPAADKMRELVAKNAPPTLFRYRADCTRSRDELTDGRIWLSSPEKYNDPYDCTFKLSIGEMKRGIERAVVADVVGRIGTSSAKDKLATVSDAADPIEALADILPDFNKSDVRSRCVEMVARVSDMLASVRKRAKVCSFSQTHRSVLMWSHYAQHHTGFCVGYPAKTLLQIPRFQLFPVVYSPQLYDVTGLAQDFATSAVDQFRMGRIILPLLQKWEVWRYEEEWRAITLQGSADPGLSCEVGKPSCIYLGSRMPEASQDELRRTCDASGIAINRMELSADRYQLVSVSA
jgi:DUF2971 family protein